MARIDDQPRRVKTLCSVPGVVGEELRCRSYGLQSTSGKAIEDASMRSFQRIPDLEHSSELAEMPSRNLTNNKLMVTATPSSFIKLASFLN